MDKPDCNLCKLVTDCKWAQNVISRRKEINSILVLNSKRSTAIKRKRGSPRMIVEIYPDCKLYEKWDE